MTVFAKNLRAASQGNSFIQWNLDQRCMQIKDDFCLLSYPTKHWQSPDYLLSLLYLSLSNSEEFTSAFQENLNGPCQGCEANCVQNLLQETESEDTIWRRVTWKFATRAGVIIYYRLVT